MSGFLYLEDMPELRVAGEPEPEQITTDVVCNLDDCR